MGLLPYAQPCAPGGGAEIRGGSPTGPWRGTPKVYSAHQLQGGLAGSPVAGKVFLFVMDERYLLAAARYVELNPVRARLVEKPERYPWSSAAAHVKGVDEALVKVAPLLGLVNDWRSLLQSGMTDHEAVLIRRHERTGRPLGEAGFVSRLESRLGRVLHPLKPGRKRKEK